MNDSILDRYSADELCEIFKEELDKLEIPYSYDKNAESVFAPLRKEDTAL
nr:MAG TPA: hypothetical protein [Caudoviricetes sp.]